MPSVRFLFLQLNRKSSSSDNWSLFLINKFWFLHNILEILLSGNRPKIGLRKLWIKSIIFLRLVCLVEVNFLNAHHHIGR